MHLARGAAGGFEAFDVPELKLTRAIQDAPSLLDRLGRDKKKYVAFIRIRTGLSIHMRLTEKQKIMEKVESIAIGLGGAEKAHVTFETPP